MMHRHLFIFLLFMGWHLIALPQENTYIDRDSSLLSQDDKIETAEIEDAIPDTTLLLRHVYISPDTISIIRNKKEFAYMSSIDSLLRKQRDQNMARFKNEKPSFSFFDRLFNSSFFKIISWLVVVGLVLFILYKLIITQGIFRKVFSKKEIEEEAEDKKLYTQSDYLKLIHQSCLLGDYRAAVKYLFLRTLQQLSDRSYIEYASDKTNYRYLREIPANKRNEFSRLILNYEYIWYGNMHIRREVYEKVEAEFTAFEKKL